MMSEETDGLHCLDGSPYWVQNQPPPTMESDGAE